MGLHVHHAERSQSLRRTGATRYGSDQERDFVGSRRDSKQELSNSLLVVKREPILQTDGDGGLVRLQVGGHCSVCACGGGR